MRAVELSQLKVVGSCMVDFSPKLQELERPGEAQPSSNPVENVRPSCDFPSVIATMTCATMLHTAHRWDTLPFQLAVALSFQLPVGCANPVGYSRCSPPRPSTSSQLACCCLRLGWVRSAGSRMPLPSPYSKFVDPWACAWPSGWIPSESCAVLVPACAPVPSVPVPL